MAFHINPDSGNATRCRATKGQCPWGGRSGSDNHYDTLNEAVAAWEQSQAHEMVPAAQKKVYLSDVDGTLLTKSLVLTNAVTLHREGVINLGDTPDRWEADIKNEELITELAVKYQASIAGRTVAFVKAKAHVNALLASDENFYETLHRLVEAKREGHEVVLITGSPDFLVAPFARKFGFKYFASTYHKDAKGRFTGEIDLMAGAAAKEKVIQELGVEAYKHVVGLGDTASDGPLLAVAHEAVMVDPTDATLESMKAKGIRIDEIIRSQKKNETPDTDTPVT